MTARLAAVALILLAGCNKNSSGGTLVDGARHLDVLHPSASDTNPGTANAPWATFQHALSSLASGDTLYVHAGTYRLDDWFTSALPSISGTAAKPTVIQNFPGHAPRIYLSERISGGWTLHAGAIWKRPLPRQPFLLPELVAVDDGGAPVLLQQVNSLETSGCGDWGLNEYMQTLLLPPAYHSVKRTLKVDENDMEPGDFFYRKSTQELFVWLPGGSNPNTHTLEAARARGISFANRQWITLRGLEFRYSNSASKGWQLQGGQWVNGTMDPQAPVLEFWQAADILVEDVKIRYGDTNGLGMGQAMRATFRNCTFGHNGHAGASSSSGRDVLFENCIFENNNWRGFWPGHGAAGIKVGFGVERMTIRSCIARNNNATGIWYDVAGPENLVERNLAYDNDGVGIFIEISGPDNTSLPPNIVRNNMVWANALGGSKIGIMLSGSQHTHIHHNSLLGNRIGLLEGDWPLSQGVRKLRHNRVFNNIVVVDGWAIGMPAEGAAWTDSMGVTHVVAEDNLTDYNLFLNPVLRVTAIGGWGGNGTDVTLAAWQAMGRDVNSLVGNPAFVGAADLHLLPGSPAIDAGTNVGVANDRDGGPRPVGPGFDIGADEVD